MDDVFWCDLPAQTRQMRLLITPAASPAAVMEQVSSAQVNSIMFYTALFRKIFLSPSSFTSCWFSSPATWESITLLIAYSGEYLTFPIWKAEFWTIEAVFTAISWRWTFFGFWKVDFIQRTQLIQEPSNVNWGCTLTWLLTIPHQWCSLQEFLSKIEFNVVSIERNNLSTPLTAFVHWCLR